MKNRSVCIRKTCASLVSRIFIPLVLHATILCALCVVVSLPPLWNIGYRDTMHSKLMSYPKGRLYMDDALRISDGLWQNKSYSTISSELKGYWFNSKEKHHYEDVRRLLRRALMISGTLLLLLLLLQSRIIWRTVWSYALLWYGVEAVIFGTWITISWNNMFKTLHWWIFQNDSWILPNRSYSLFLYPHPVWKMAGIFVFVSFLMILLLGFTLSRFPRNHRLAKPRDCSMLP